MSSSIADGALSAPATTAAVEGAVARSTPTPAVAAPVDPSPSATAPAPGGGLSSSTAASAGSPLAFDMPSASVLRGSPKKAFAHYIPSLPISLDNKPAGSDYYQRNYLTPTGEGGRHAAYGGYARDRPLPRPVRPESNWRLLDMESEVRSAVAAGLDGFALVLWQLGEPSAQAENSKLLMQAAHNVGRGFKIIPQPDLSSASPLVSRSPQAIAKYVAELMSYPSAYRLSDGRYVLSAFNAETKSVSWWQQVIAILGTTYGKSVAFLPVVQDERPTASLFAPISYGISTWGNRNPRGNNPSLSYPDAPTSRIARVQALGLKWMQAISVQDQRPRDGIFDEAENTTNLRKTWQLAIKGRAQFAHLVTWGDYPEGSVIAPTVKHGWSFLDISAYYLTHWKTGAAPPIVRDTIYLSHRTQFLTAQASFPQTKLMKLRKGSSPGRNTVEALTFLTAPGTVTINAGGQTHSCAVAAGVDTCTVPLSLGTVSATVNRGGAAVASVTSPYPVTATPYVQDFQYVATSSGRQGNTGRVTRQALPPSTTPSAVGSEQSAPATASASALTAAPAQGKVSRTQAERGVLSRSTRGGITTIRVAAIGDSYVSANARTTNYGGARSLAVRADPGYVTYLRFALPRAPAGKRLTKAVLRVRTADSIYAGTRSVQDVALVRTRWRAGSVTWNNRPTSAKTTIGSLSRAWVPNQLYYSSALRVGSLQRLLGSNRTFAITSRGDDSLRLWSRNNTRKSSHPRLILTYS